MSATLRESTYATLHDLLTFDWFARVGERHAEVSTAVVLSNWFEAAASVDEGGAWENLLLDAANGYCEQLWRVAPTRFRRWNEIVEAIKVYSEPMVAQVFASRPGLCDLPKAIHDTVQWDTLHVCLEAEFSDCLPIGFYHSNVYWYRVGHFPCGWRGRFPDGRLVIY